MTAIANVLWQILDFDVRSKVMEPKHRTLRVDIRGQLLLQDVSCLPFWFVPCSNLIFEDQQEPIASRDLILRTACTKALYVISVCVRVTLENCSSWINLQDFMIFVAGDAFNYTTHGYTLLSAIVEKASGEKFEKHMKRMFRDLGLQSTYLDENEPLIPNRARYVHFLLLIFVFITVCLKF